MLVSELVERVRYRIADTQNVGYKTPELLAYINEGHRFLYRTVVRYAPMMLSVTESRYTESGIAISDLSLKVLKIIDLRLNGKPVPRIDIRAVKDLTAAGVPQYHYLQNFIRWVPIPNGEFSFTATYIPESPRLVEANDSAWPADFEDLIVEYAAIRAFMRNEFATTVEERFMAMFHDQITQILASMTPDFSVVKGYYDSESMDPNLVNTVNSYWR